MLRAVDPRKAAGPNGVTILIIIKFADNTNVMEFSSGGDETAYRNEVQPLPIMWCKENNLVLNNAKTKDLLTNSRKEKKLI